MAILNTGMAAEDKSTRLKSSMTIAFIRPLGGLVPVPPGLRRSGPFYIGNPKEPESEPDLDTYTIIFAALAFVICLRLRSVSDSAQGASGRPT